MIHPACPRLPVAHRPALAVLAALCLGTGVDLALAQAEAGLEAALADRVRALVGPNIPLPSATAAAPRVAIEIGKLDARLRLAPCQRVEPQLPAQGALWGRTRIGLRCVEGERPWQVWLPVTVKVFAPALVPTRALAAGTVLAAEHLQPAEVDWATDVTPPFTRADDLLGRTLNRAVQPGQPLRQGDLRARQYFAAGDTVRVQARGNGFTVGGEGQAINAGVEGQTVRVRTESGRILSGMPVADHQVEVQL